MTKKLDSYLVEVPESLSSDHKDFRAFRLEIKCQECGHESIEHYPDDFDDISVFRCITCGKEKWIPIYGDSYGLTDFGIFFEKKFKMNEELKIELASYFDASFEAYCQSCECGGRFTRPHVLLCYKCGSKKVEVTNSDDIYWRDNPDLYTPVKIEWLKYYKHPF